MYSETFKHCRQRRSHYSYSFFYIEVIHKQLAPNIKDYNIKNIHRGFY